LGAKTRRKTETRGKFGIIAISYICVKPIILNLSYQQNLT